jgi:hypothetical protein
MFCEPDEVLYVRQRGDQITHFVIKFKELEDPQELEYSAVADAFPDFVSKFHREYEIASESESEVSNEGENGSHSDVEAADKKD